MELVNRVATSGIITLKLEDWLLPESDIATFDLKDYLFMEMILKEKDFRAALKTHDWSQYTGKHLLVYCSTDAIIPLWAYMLVAVHASPIAEGVFQGDEEAFQAAWLRQKIEAVDVEDYRDRLVVVKGCGDRSIPASAYLDITQRLQPLVKSLMFGEPCSTVPVYKRPKNK